MKNNYLKTSASPKTKCIRVKNVKGKLYNKNSNQVKMITGRRDN
jgi:hypothetical protein